MDRTTRTLVVVVVSVVVAAAATYLVYRALVSRPVQAVEVAHAYAVVAARPLTVGSRVAAADVKVVPWPAAYQVPGGFANVEEVIDRGVLSPIAENQPLTNNNIALPEAGAGLPPTIPAGMRAVAVRVNEVVGVAGFVVPGTRVDVMYIAEDGAGRLARVVVSNVEVLASGTKYDRESASGGEAIPSTVVTLLVTPEDAQRIGLAANDGQIILTLRNPLDTVPTDVAAIRTENLMKGSAPAEPASPSASAPPVARPPVARAPAPRPRPEPPPPYTVETIRGADRTQEILEP